MKCPQCGQENKKHARFCISCGEALTNTETREKVVYCVHCGHKNTGAANYCAACGSEIVQVSPTKKSTLKSRKQSPKNRKRRPKNAPQKNWTFGKTMAIVVGLLVVLLVAFKAMEDSSTSASSGSDVSLMSDADPFVASQVTEVASKFYCVCGGCENEPLEECSCETALAEKQFIRDSFQDGKTTEQVIAAMIQTYGGLEPEFQDQYGTQF